jgi:hypothetical protein
MVEPNAAVVFFEENRDSNDSYSRLQPVLTVQQNEPATSCLFCLKTRSSGESCTVPSLFPLRRDGQWLN